jgi:tyrosine-protein kinase
LNTRHHTSDSPVHEPDTAQSPADRLGLYLATLRRRWWVAAAIVFVAVLAGLAVASTRPPAYEARSQVLVDRQRQVDALLGGDTSSPDPERDLNTDVQLVRLDAVANDVKRALGLRMTTADLLGRVTATADANSSIVTITAVDDNPAAAAAIANSFASEYRAYRAASARAAMDDAVASAEARLRTLPPGAGRARLGNTLHTLQSAAAAQTGGVQVVGRASAATASAQPRTTKSAAVALVLGLLLAGVAIVVMTRSDRRIRSAGDAERVAGAPVVGVVPELGTAEAREALVSLAVTAPASPGKASSTVLLLTPTEPDGDAPDLALGLARAHAAVGRRVIMVEADLREPRFAERIGHDAGNGLVGILEGHGRLNDELVALDDPVGAGSALVLPAGRAMDSPQALLSGEPIEHVVWQARRRADMVIVTSAPTTAGSDALQLARLADTVLLVARRDRTDGTALANAARALARADAAPAGVVLMTPRPLGVTLRAALPRRGPAPQPPAHVEGEITRGESVRVREAEEATGMAKRDLASPGVWLESVDRSRRRVLNGDGHPPGEERSSNSSAAGGAPEAPQEVTDR